MTAQTLSFLLQRANVSARSRAAASSTARGRPSKQAPSRRHQLFKTGCADIIRTDTEGIAAASNSPKNLTCAVHPTTAGPAST